MKNTINVNYFKELNAPEKCYWLGFITADGSITPKRNKVSFMLKSTDIDILYKFKKAINTTNKIAVYDRYDKRTNKIYHLSSLQVCSAPFTQNLCTTGIDYDKSKHFDFSKIPLEYMDDFVRGLIDGDGGIMKTRLKIISTLEFINFLKSYYADIKFNCLIQIKDNVWGICIHKDRLKFLTRIYENNKVCLNRKKVEYENLKISVGSEIKYTDVNVEVSVYKNGEFIGKYDSLTSCAKELNLITCCISNQLAGRVKTHKGYTFKRGQTFIIKHLKNGKQIKYTSTSR